MNDQLFYQAPVENQLHLRTPGWQETATGLCAVSSAAQSLALMQLMPDRGYLRADIHIVVAQQAGVILRAAEDLGKGYYLCLEPEQGRLVLRSWLRMYEEDGKTFPYDVEMEVPVRKTADGRYTLEVIWDGSAATAYVNAEAALSFRMYDLAAGNLGLFSLGQTVFSNIEMYR